MYLLVCIVIECALTRKKGFNYVHKKYIISFLDRFSFFTIKYLILLIYSKTHVYIDSLNNNHNLFTDIK